MLRGHRTGIHGDITGMSYIATCSNHVTQILHGGYAAMCPDALTCCGSAACGIAALRDMTTCSMTLKCMEPSPLFACPGIAGGEVNVDDILKQFETTSAHNQTRQQVSAMKAFLLAKRPC